LRFRDASLTGAQMLSAFFVIVVSAYFIDKGARGVVLPILLMIFYFGIYRLDSQQMTTLALITIAMYGAMLWVLHAFKPEGLDMQLEFLYWWIFSVVALWFALVSGHVSRLRRELALRKAAIEALLERDELTGVGNRRYLTQTLEQEKNRSDRTGTPFCVAMLDLDHFKRVNDTYGHQAGDRLLKAFAQIVQVELRKIDYFGRYGGEEFTLVMADTRLDGALVMAERLRDNMEHARHADIDPALVQTVSIGVAEHRRGESIEQTLLRADRAMYKAKARGRNCVESDADSVEYAARVTPLRKQGLAD
jgi:diguanylate cyclase (GGDEF)-like protein